MGWSSIYPYALSFFQTFAHMEHMQGFLRTYARMENITRRFCQPQTVNSPCRVTFHNPQKQHFRVTKQMGNFIGNNNSMHASLCLIILCTISTISTTKGNTICTISTISTTKGNTICTKAICRLFQDPIKTHIEFLLYSILLFKL